MPVPGIEEEIPTGKELEWYLTATRQDGTDTNSRSWTNVPIGRAETGRVIVVAVADVGHSSINSVTVNGVSLTRRTSNTNVASIWSGVVAAGTSVTISMGASGSGDRTVAIDVYAIYAANSAVPTNQAYGGSPLSPSWPDSSVVIAVARGNSSSAMTGVVPQLDKTQFPGNIEYIIGGAVSQISGGSGSIAVSSSSAVAYASFA